MTRILALVTEAYGYPHGIAQAARDLIGALAEQVDFVDVLPRQVEGPVHDLPANVRQAGPIAGRIGYSARALAAALRTRPGLVLCNHLFMAPLAAVAARTAGARLIIQLHGIEIWSPPTAAQRRALEAADLLLCVSRDTRARLLAHADIAPERAVVVNNSIGTQFMPGDRAAARAKFGFSNDYVILTTGRMARREGYKGHERIIAALPSLTAPDSRPLVYVIAGSGDDRPRIEAAARDAGLGDRVRFLGQLPAEDLPDLYRAADLFCLPSTGEGFGIAFVEAMRSGTPALGLACGGAPDALGDGELGTMAEPGADFAAALAAAMREPPDRRLAERVEARFGRDDFRERVGQVLALVGPHG